MNSLWLTFSTALMVDLAMYYFLGWLNFGDWVHGLLGPGLFIASVVAVEMLQPWRSTSPWLGAMNAFLVGLGTEPV